MSEIRTKYEDKFKKNAVKLSYESPKGIAEGKAANHDAAAIFEITFDGFRKEAVKRKAVVNRRDVTLSDFAAWLVEQQNTADRLIKCGALKTD